MVKPHAPLLGGASAAAEGAATHSDSPCVASLPRSCTRKLPSRASAADSAHCWCRLTSVRQRDQTTGAPSKTSPRHTERQSG